MPAKHILELPHCLAPLKEHSLWLVDTLQVDDPGKALRVKPPDVDLNFLIGGREPWKVYSSVLVSEVVKRGIVYDVKMLAKLAIAFEVK